jgi:hypothetical protein
MGDKRRGFEMTTTAAASTLSDLYEADETAWLDAMSDLIRSGRRDELDYAHLAEYLTDMAKRDRRAVMSRLVVLLVHVLKWEHQTRRRTGGWKATIFSQRHRLRNWADGGVLRAHAEAVLPTAYAQAVVEAAAETGLSPEAFPATCPYTLDQLLAYTPAD